MVQQQLAGGKILKTGELGVSVAQGVVTLRGTVPHIWARDRAVKLAMEVAGVQAVDSELDIAFEESDKKLGENVAKKIRGYVFFTIYDDVNIGVEEGIVNPNRKKREQSSAKVLTKEPLGLCLERCFQTKHQTTRGPYSALETISISPELQQGSSDRVHRAEPELVWWTGTVFTIFAPR